MGERTYLGVDLGASSGRVMAGWRNGEGRIELQEVRRFANEPLRTAGSLVWNFEGLMTEIMAGLQLGIAQAREAGRPVVSIGIDSWGVDFGLVGKDGELIGPVYHYRDKRNDGQMEKVFQKVCREDIFRRTGIQFLPFNTIYQLNAVAELYPERLEQADHFMMIADLVAWRLTGKVSCEYTNATTTQLVDVETGTWSGELLGALGVPERLFGSLVKPGEVIGALREELAREWNAGNVQVVAVATHDTGSAVVAVPSGSSEFAYLSSGTWSLLGTEVESAVTGDGALDANFTNEGGARGAFRLLKNIMGLWILQECQRHWKAAGERADWEYLLAQAGGSGWEERFDVDDPRFLAPEDMLQAIGGWYAERGLAAPESQGDVARATLLSLSDCYARTLARLEGLTGERYDALHIVGGGSQNGLLCEMTARCIGRPVLAGPVEATVIGNIGVQMMAQGEFGSLAQLREAVAASFPLIRYSA